MPEDVLLRFGIGFCTAGFWLASVAMVIWDGRRHGVMLRRQAGWVLVAFLLPFLGFVLYLIIGRRQSDPRPKGGTVVMRAPTFDGPGSAPQPPVRQPEPAAPRRGYIVDEEEFSTVPAAYYQQGAAAPRPGGYRLVATVGPHAGQSFPLDQLPAQIGRSAECAIRLQNDRSISRQHAEIYNDGYVLHVRDLNSTHGTRVNGYRVNEYALQLGDEVQIGQTLLVVQEAV